MVACSNRYQHVRLLGRGGSGEVVLVKDRARADQLVALKRIRRSVDGSLRSAFEREFSTMASISAPGVSEVFDFGLMPAEPDDPGGPFFTRAYADGVPFDEATEPLGVGDRIRRVVALIDVIAPLHRVGVTHGDIKPGNVIVDRAGRVQLIDFGLARMLGVAAHNNVQGGSPLFMAPELLSGEPPSLAGDIYALGVLLWLTVCGELPFGRGADAVRARLAGEPPTLPHGLDDLGSAAMQVALRALRSDPLDRFPTVAELRAALLPVLGSPPQADVGTFVPPRPRGHEGTLARCESALAKASAGVDGTTLLLHGPPGSGRSQLLREVKWRLQMSGAVVLEVSAARGFSSGVAGALLAQVRALLGEHRAALEALDASACAGLSDVQSPPGSRIADALRAALAKLEDAPRVVWLVDDLDMSEVTLGAVLRSLVHASGTPNICVLATAHDLEAPPVAELAAEQTIDLEPLPRSDVAALSVDALGPVDTSVLEAISEVTGGLPGAVVETLAGLCHLAAPTADDVRQLSTGQARRALLEARLGRAEPESRPLLELLSLVRCPVGLPTALKLLGESWAAAETGLSVLVGAGLVSRVADGIGLADPGVGRLIVEDLGPRAEERARAIYERGLVGLSGLARARLLVASASSEAVRREVPELAATLAAHGDNRSALELYEAALAAHDDDVPGPLRLQALRARQALGDHERCAELAAALVQDEGAGAEPRAQAAIVAGRALTALARFDAAARVLDGVPGDAQPNTRAQVACELARVHMRAGDYDAAATSAADGLAAAGEGANVRIDLLCCQGAIEGYRSQAEVAEAHYREALALAERYGSQRDVSRVQSYLALGCWRAGQHQRSRELLDTSLASARAAGDIGLMANASLNLGAILFHLGEFALAEEHYQSASRLARRAGSFATALQARNNLAHIHVHFGLFEQARGELQALLRDAEGAKHRYILAQVKAIEGDLAARTGDVDSALVNYDDAIARYQQIGQDRERVLHHLQAAEALLDRGGASDASAAAHRLATARKLMADHPDREMGLKLRLLTSRARTDNGDAEAAVVELEQVIDEASGAEDHDVQWAAHAAASHAHGLLGTGFAARRHVRAAVEILEHQAVRLPRAHREAFWHDPRRRWVRERAAEGEDSSHHTNFDRGEVALTMADPRTVRLLEILKRLAAEREVDRLLDRITESAVDLSGAERGFVLLTDDTGTLCPRAARDRKAGAQDPSVAFSRSIAEAVLIDGEPIVTVDAADDGRVNEYASVHNLMLRSVACLPIRTPERVEGVLYLEHRRSRGRFIEPVVELLHAFADQAAIALTNARLYAENAARRAELEQSNAALAKAKHELEDALSARTRQLEEVREQLTRVQPGRTARVRYGMVGQGEAMRRVFGMIERLCDASVPVVVCGESGTGKELVARGLHFGGVREKAPFVAVNCGALPETLLESELFGHAKGAFSGADRERVGMIQRASGGTLFLDEVSDMPPKMQIDLLRVLQEGTVCKLGSSDEEDVAVRVVAATQRPLLDLVAAGKFREDLYYRLSVVDIVLPPLRARREDIDALCRHLLAGFASSQDAPCKRLSSDALSWLMQQLWPGNVRQLSHALLQASVMHDGEVITASHLEADGDASAPLRVIAAADDGGQVDNVPIVADGSDAENVGQYRDAEKRRILRALEDCAWNRAQAARSLGMARRTFYRRLQDYEIL